MHYSNPYIELCLEGASSVFKILNQKEKDSLAQNHRIYQIKKGWPVFNENDKPQGLICLISGKIKVFKEGVGGREQIVRMVKHHGMIGYRALFADYVWHMSARAVEDSTICVLDKNALVKIMKKNPDLTLRFIKILSEELLFSDKRIISLTQKHTRGRIAESLLILRDTYGLEEDGKTISAFMSREDIASLSSMTTSNAIRTLSDLAGDGIIGIKGRRISINDAAGLESISEAG